MPSLSLLLGDFPKETSSTLQEITEAHVTVPKTQQKNLKTDQKVKLVTAAKAAITEKFVLNEAEPGTKELGLVYDIGLRVDQFRKACESVDIGDDFDMLNETDMLELQTKTEAYTSALTNKVVFDAGTTEEAKTVAQ
eukprot:1051742-Ditylum_brightwellii.AAC.1